jgi:chromosome partitioning protein
VREKGAKVESRGGRAEDAAIVTTTFESSVSSPAFAADARPPLGSVYTAGTSQAPRYRVVFNQKGGVGKTTLATNLATCAALAGARTLLVDADPNANATQHLLGREQGPGHTIANFFDTSLGISLFNRSVTEFVVASPRVPGLHLLAGDRRLDDLRPKLESRHKINKLRDGLAGVPYQQIYFDTPPTLDFYSLSCLIAAHELIIPIDCDAFSVKAAEEVRKAVEEVRHDHNPQLVIAGVVVNHHQRSTRHSSRMVAELRRLGFRVLEPFIPASVKVRESHSEKAPFMVRHGEHPVGKAFSAVFQAITQPSSNA